jgi:alpha-L-rhamnosidase
LLARNPLEHQSLSDDTAEFESIVNQLWGGTTQGSMKGRVYGDQKVADVLTAMKVLPDFEYTKPQADTELLLFTGR